MKGWAARLQNKDIPWQQGDGTMAAETPKDESPRARPRRLALALVDCRRAGRDFAWLTLEAPPDWESLPGQFVNVLCESDPRAAAASEGRLLDDKGEWPRTTGLEIGRRRPVVRRPYSIARVVRRGRGVRLELLVRAVGSGSRFLHSRPIGSALDVVGPLGSHFTSPADDRLCLLVGGGCGVAPIFGLADTLAAAGKACLCFFGAPSVRDMPVEFLRSPLPTEERVEMTEAVGEFAAVGVPTVLATDDGSAGFHGTVVEALGTYLERAEDGKAAALYGCGPAPMLRTLSDLAARRRWPCQVSMERFMGCGIGVCLSCAAKQRDADNPKGWTYRLTCREGPVVEGRNIIWDEP